MFGGILPRIEARGIWFILDDFKAVWGISVCHDLQMGKGQWGASTPV